jgi:hypothetical protein
MQGTPTLDLNPKPQATLSMASSKGKGEEVRSKAMIAKVGQQAQQQGRSYKLTNVEVQTWQTVLAKVSRGGGVG